MGDNELESLKSAIGKNLSLNDRLSILDEIGRDDLVRVFNSWKPRVSKARKRNAPLDQRVAITITRSERFLLDDELKKLKKHNKGMSLAHLIRSRSMRTVDLVKWRDIASKALVENEETEKNIKELRARKSFLEERLIDEKDADEIFLARKELERINTRISKVTAQNKHRSFRLSGRMSMAEAETIKWRAQRLHLSSSDYLRMVLFDCEPDSEADSHMSLDSKRRFYLAIIDVADNGWGDVPKIYNCRQCANYMDRIVELEEQLRQNEAFARATL